MLAIPNPFDMLGEQFLSFYMYTAVLALVVAAALRWQAKGGSADAARVDLNPYEVAYLRESPSLALRAAVANLISKKALELDPTGSVTRTGVQSHAHPLEEAILLTASTPTTLRTLERRVSTSLDRIGDRLEELGLLVDGAKRNLARVGGLLVGGVVAVGAIKIVVGVARDKPVGYLVLLVVVTIILRLVINALIPLHRTRAGERAIARMQDKYREESARDIARGEGASAHPAGLAYGFDPMTMMVALYGMQMLAYHPTLAPMQTVLTPPAPVGGGDSVGVEAGSDSGGDSGGDASCSSGCGGCGGGD
jgi:uncharacterized protein (TIGR04222 family)